MDRILGQGKQKGDGGMDAADKVKKGTSRVSRYIPAHNAARKGRITKDERNLVGLRKG
jgi:hypothetical protein